MAEKAKPTPQSQPHKQSYLKDIILLFAIPAAIAVIAALAVYIPKLMANPKYDFIYSVCSSYDCDDGYSVDDAGRITQSNTSIVTNDYTQSTSLRLPTPTLPTLRYYDVETDSSKTITVTEAQSYTLDDSSRSPDGYTLSREETGGGFLLWGDYDQGWYLKDGAKKQKVNLTQTNSYGYSSDQINFVGWVK